LSALILNNNKCLQGRSIIAVYATWKNYITTPGNARKKLYRGYPEEEIMYFYETIDLER